MRRQALLWPLVLCPIVWAPGVFAQPPAEIGKASFVRLVVTHGPDGHDEKSYPSLNNADPIYEKTKVVTAEKASTEILVGRPAGKRGLVQLGSKTKFTFERWVEEAALGQGGHELRLFVGQVAALFWSDATDEHTVTIHTPTGPVQLRGTAVYLDVTPGSTFVYVREGQATVESLDEEGNLVGKPVDVAEGWQTRVALGQPPEDPTPFPSSSPPDLGPPGWIIDPPVFDPSDPRLNLPK